jgi:hypothetical protein
MSILFTLTQTCDLYAPVMGENGRPGYSGTASTTGEKCRVEANSRELRTDKDTVIRLDATIFVGPGATVDEQYKVVVGSTSYVVEQVQTMRGLTAVDHYELLCRGI